MSFKPILIMDQQHPQLPCAFCKNSVCRAKSDAPNALVPWLSLDQMCYCCKAPKFGQKREKFPLFLLFSITAWQSELSARNQERHLPRRKDNAVFATGGTSRSHHILWKPPPSFLLKVGQGEGKSSGLTEGEQREVHFHRVKHKQPGPTPCQNPKRKIWLAQSQ